MNIFKKAFRALNKRHVAVKKVTCSYVLLTDWTVLEFDTKTAALGWFTLHVAKADKRSWYLYKRIKI